jgi:hypothetical protein
VAEVWFDSLDDLKAGIASEAGQGATAAPIADERRFIDHSASPIWVSEEVEISLG